MSPKRRRPVESAALQVILGLLALGSMCTIGYVELSERQLSQPAVPPSPSPTP
jgi:hypothetical protein